MIVDRDTIDEYAGRHPLLVETAEKLQIYLKKLVAELPRIDSVSVRAKDPARYIAKATKVSESGQPKYPNPRYGIQDQIGARINVLYLSDVELVRQHIVTFIRHIEETSKSPEDAASFGYFGHHFIFQTPDEVIPDDDCDAIPEFFELQIKTLFQHAWSETHHDLGYKPSRKLTSDEHRKMAFTAAQAWGADKIFEELAQTVAANENLST